jgi:tricarballylate dehydrogenase
MVRRGSPYNTGDGLRMAEAVGARLDWMEDFHGGIIHYGYKAHPEYGAVAGMRHIIGYETGLIVNRDGQRFVDEGENISEKTYAKFGKIIPLKQPGGFAFVVYDAQSRDAVDPLYAGPEAEPVEAPSIAALADAIGVPRQALIDTVTSFNAGVRDGKSLTVSPPKSNYARRLEVPPFFAHKVTGGFTFTFGGLRTRANGEVLGTDGRWIAGLFATGEITTGLFYGNYGGGSSLPKCAIFGRLAGAAAAGYAKRAARQ